MKSIDEMIGHDRIIPVLAFDSVEQALMLSRELVEGGIRLLEITLRTPVALQAIRAVADEIPDAIVGVGTVLDTESLEAAMHAGATFGVSPGLTRALADAITANDFPFIPGVGSVSEMLAARDQGFRIQKFFPAEVLGGVRFLKSIKDVIQDVSFCTTGGLNPDNAPAYLALENVRAIGGSWMICKTPAGDIDIAQTRQALAGCRALVAG